MPKSLVATIPPGITLDAALAAMRGMGDCYPPHALAIRNSPDGGMDIIYDSEATTSGGAEHASSVGVSVGVEKPGDLLAYAFSLVNDDERAGAKAVATWMIGELERAGAANYLTHTVEVPGRGRYALTVQRCSGKTPAERIAELESEVESLRVAGAAAVEL